MSKSKQRTTAAQGFIILIWEGGSQKKVFTLAFCIMKIWYPKLESIGLCGIL